MESIEFLTPEFLMTTAGQILAVTALVALTRWLIGDKIKTVYYAVIWAVTITMIVAFWARLPVDAQTAVVAVLNAVLLVLGAYGVNKGVVWGKNKRQPDEEVSRSALSDMDEAYTAKRKAFSNWV